MTAHRRPVFAANWKMHLGPTPAREFMDVFMASHAAQSDRTVIFFPPAISLAAVRAAAGSRADLLLGVQNVHSEEKGAFTGETAAGMAADAGASFALVGHSERRHVFGETDAQVAQKCARAESVGVTPLLCVGETIEQREKDETEAVVLHQLRAGVSAMSDEAVRAMIVAYEPVWAIGTGRTATPEDASAVHRVIRAALVELVGDGAHEIPILYGGSVNAGNVETLLAADQVDGVLVGGASLDPVGWAGICRTGISDEG
ncbi:MAG: Triosephosphate isomerase, bacterial/eukaryotic [Gemmatimonadetes bacterium]|jgi:triosephosphate isomerase|nr:Triosephosphate isomerase, bacterial/eukaryotic [Gemmatimonadota bacterium]